jgi:hypothetical protein
LTAHPLVGDHKENMRKRIFLIFSLILVLLLSACKEKNSPVSVAKARDIKEYARKFMSIEVLEKSGFERISSDNFELLLEGETSYILNSKDYLIVKFKGNTPQRIFKTREGQAPGEMITPYSLFRYNESIIAIFDTLRKTVFFFDNDLNYVKEIKVYPEFDAMTREGKNIIAIYSSLEENMYAQLDENFRVVRTTVKSNKTFPFKRVYNFHLNLGFFLDNSLVSHSFSMFLYKKCKANIYNVNTGELVVTLNWEQPFSPTAKSIYNRMNCYFLYHLGKYGSYYVVHTTHSRALLDRRRYYEFRIFDEEGVLRYKDDFSNRIMAVSKKTPDSKLYFMDDDEGISYIDIEEFMK